MKLRTSHQHRTCTHASPPDSTHGFTLVELMVVVALIAILLAVAVPSFKSVVQRNRIAAQLNGFISDVHLARSEAIKRGLPVSLCASSDGANCLETNTWHLGWMMFFDPTGLGTRTSASTTQELIKIQKRWVSTDTFAADTPTPTKAISYNRDGFASSGPVTMVLHTAPVEDSATKCVAISVVGRHTLQSRGEGSCS
jgi:type IV fimbrial biogenesis protein FimT